MNIEAEGLPVAGETFFFRVSGAAGEKTVKALLEYRPLLERSFSGLALRRALEIPPQTGGFTLKILAHAASGEKAEMRYVVGGEKAPEDGPSETRQTEARPA